jgi:hypothetical protein
MPVALLPPVTTSGTFGTPDAGESGPQRPRTYL